MMAILMWHKNGEQMIANKCIVLDTFLLYEINKLVVEFKTCINRLGFKWGKLLYNIANGVHIHREPILR